jgi:16S rRNA (adenine1518-N6/adenine1519-N6)-dimethyltransferase
LSKSKRQKLGQHFLKSKNIAQTIVDAAKITKKDIVFEVGTGRGVLTRLLCARAAHVISAEADETLYSEALLGLADFDNLELIRGDGFDVDAKFSVFVSNLPYSESRNAIEWLAKKDFRCAMVMVQKEFAEKIVLCSGRNMRAVSVVANHAFEMEKIMDIGRNNFDPPPKVDSVVLKLQKKSTLPESLIKTVNRLFSYRRKTISNIAKKFGKEITSDKRLEELDAEEIIALARQLN